MNKKEFETALATLDELLRHAGVTATLVDEQVDDSQQSIHKLINEARLQVIRLRKVLNLNDPDATASRNLLSR